MTHGEFQSCLVRQFLQSDLPQSRAVAIAPTSVSGDEQLSRSRKTGRPHFLPPIPDASRGKLGRIVTDVPVEFDLQACKLSNYDRDAVGAVFQSHEFHSLMSRLPAPGGEGTARQLSMFEQTAPEAPPTHTVIVRDDAALGALVQTLQEAALIAFDTETTSTDPMQAELVGISLAVQEGIGLGA